MTRVTPEPVRHVVAATDFSEPAAVGVAWAHSLARAHGAKLDLVHAVLDIDASLWTIDAPPDLTEAALAAARERLEEAARELSDEGVTVRTHVDVGQPSQVILHRADEVGADLVVLATRGTGGLRHLLLGSTAERVVHHAEMPVLSVHESDRAPVAEARHVLLPTDFSDDARLAREAARRVFPFGEGSRIHLLHVFQLPHEYEIYRAETFAEVYRSFRRDLREDLEAELHAVATELEATGAEIEVEVLEGHAGSMIVNRAAELGVDLIAMGTHGRSTVQRLLLGSTARRVVQHAPCPVLTVRNPRAD